MNTNNTMNQQCKNTPVTSHFPSLFLFCPLKEVPVASPRDGEMFSLHKLVNVSLIFIGGGGGSCSVVGLLFFVLFC